MLVSLPALFPAIDAEAYGQVILPATGNWSPFVIRFCQAIMQRIERRSWRVVRRHVSSAIGFVILMGSALCVTRYGEAFNWPAASRGVLGAAEAACGRA